MTVITPTLNRREMLADTIASVHLQDYSHIEHIVVDGGSDDGTVDLLRKAERRWGVRWISQPDEGMYEAINTGLGMATGSIVGWLNSDDWLLPWSVSTVVEAMEGTKTPHAVYGDYLGVAPHNPLARMRVYGSFSRSALASVTTLAQPTVFWPRAFTDDLGDLDTTTFRQIADCEYWLRLSCRYPFMRVREFLAVGQDHAETKRFALADEISAEFEALRRHYRVPNFVARAQRVLATLRWRREWAALLAERGWQKTRRSDLVALPWDGLSAARRFSLYGPQRRHPLTVGLADIRGLFAALAIARAEIDDVVEAPTPGVEGV